MTLPTKAQIDTALATLDAVVGDLAPFESFLPSTWKVAVADAQKVIAALEAAVNTL